MNRNTKSMSSNVFQVKIDSYRAKIDKALLTELKQHRESIFFVPIKCALKNGKRLRPVLLILSYENAGKKEKDPFPAAVAVELTHLESLIHDDIIDKDLVRRETPSMHALYGYELALLSADFILSIVLDITARYNDSRIQQALARATARMCEGELEELKAYKNKNALSIDEYINIISKKTASLFEAAATIGAIIGNAKKDEIKALSNYGRLLGIAYQIQDDIPDLNNTMTINIANLLKTDTEKIAHLQEMSKSYILEAKNSLKKLNPCEAQSLLLELADYVISSSIERV